METLTPTHTTRSRTTRLRAFEIAVPVVLMALTWLLVWAWPQLMQAGSGPPDRVAASGGLSASWLTYLTLAAVFLPLALSRKYPLVILGVSVVASSVYGLFPSNPPAPVMLAPLLSLFLVGTVCERRTVWISFTAVTVFTLVVQLHPFSGTSWIADSIATAAVFAVAASVGDAARNRRALFASLEQRAIDAERTREEEAQRRVEEERLRIARELHDVTAHSLSIIALQAGAAEKAVKRDPDAVIRALQTIRTTSKDSLDELRAMLGVLRSADEDAPLTPAGRLERLPELVRTVEEAGVHMTLDVSADVTEIPAYADVSAFRIVQEAITNVVRHAQATSVRVTVHAEEDALLIEVVDDGRGMQPGQAEGHGLVGMRERAAALGGTFEAGPAPGGGFRIAARLPIVKGAQRRDR